MQRRRPTLADLCRVYGVQPSYRDVFGRLKTSPRDSIIKVLIALGARLDPHLNLDSAYRSRLTQLKSRIIEPVVVLFDGATSIPLKLKRDIRERAECRLRIEGKVDSKKWTINPKDQNIEEETYRLKLPYQLPYGYHILEIEAEGVVNKALIISSPSKTYQLRGKIWGLYVPLYALHSRRSWGAGTYLDLLKLVKWASKVRAGFVGTTPLLPLNPTLDPSPYTPFSRVFWSEFYVDLNTPSNLRRLSRGLKELLRKVKSSRRVDYEGIVRIKQEVASAASQRAIDERSQIRRYIREHPELIEYAGFRASKEAASGEEYESKLQQHLYMQILAQMQIKQLSNYAKKQGVRLYLDLPIGCSPEGYDAWRWSGIFVKDAYVGAPPDFFFPKGQNWGVNPIHPEKIREDGYSYFIECIRHHMRYADLLRLDHVMALHRLYWIPKGAASDSGVYVKYRAEEFYAIISLESHRHRCAVVGENLGTVPKYINEALDRHGLIGCFILQLKPPATLSEVKPNTLAAINTHDTPPFKAYLKGLDIELRLKLGLIDGKQAEGEMELRRHHIKELKQHLKKKGLLKAAHTQRDLLEATLKLLAQSRAKILQINLEDLWLEEEMHNIPGTGPEAGNWRHKAKLSIEQITRNRDVSNLLSIVSKCIKA